MSDSHDKVIKNVVILVAMEAEANPMIKHLGLTEKTDQFPPKAPSKCFSGTYKESTVHVVTNGKCRRFGVDNIGTDSATLSTWLALETLSPDLMINAGTAGGFMKHGTSIGDVFLSSKVCNHDRRIPIPGFNEFGIGNHVAVPTPGLQEALSCQAGVVTTGNSFDHTEMDDKMMDGNDARVKDMEAAAVAWVCEQHSVPLFCIKVVTDLVDGGGVGQEEFLQNLKAASEALQATVPKCLDFAIGRKTSDL